MFKDVETFHAALADFASDALREVIASFLIPVSVLVPRTDQDSKSLTFVGGTPTMSPELEWPIPPKPENIEEIVQRGGDTHSKDLREALESGFPYPFLGQIDLSEIQSPLLPNSGRLLFFYDDSVGPWDCSTRVAKVIWDDAPIEILVDFPPDETLVKAEADWNAEARNFVSEPFIKDEKMKQKFLDLGLTEQDIELTEHTDEHVYFGPKRLMQVETHYQTALPYNLEWQDFTQSVLNKFDEDLPTQEFTDIFLESEFMYNTVPFQVLGMPVPEQDDPRYDAAIPLLFNKWILEEGEWNEHKPAIMQEAKNLCLLFQVSLADWTQEIGEGMVYFYIRKDDLKARNFDAVVAVYQQT